MSHLSAVCQPHYGVTVLTVSVNLVTFLTPLQSSCQSKSGCGYYLIMFIVTQWAPFMSELRRRDDNHH